MGDVARASGNKQRPAVYSHYAGTAYLGPRPQDPGITPQPAPVQPAAPPPQHPVPANMVWVEGGTFSMGSDSGEGNEKPVHQVTVQGFYMGKYEVTQKRMA